MKKKQVVEEVFAQEITCNGRTLCLREEEVKLRNDCLAQHEQGKALQSTSLIKLLSVASVLSIIANDDKATATTSTAFQKSLLAAWLGPIGEPAYSTAAIDSGKHPFGVVISHILAVYRLCQYDAEKVRAYLQSVAKSPRGLFADLEREYRDPTSRVAANKRTLPPRAPRSGKEVVDTVEDKDTTTVNLKAIPEWVSESVLNIVSWVCSKDAQCIPVTTRNALVKALDKALLAAQSSLVQRAPLQHVI